MEGYLIRVRQFFYAPDPNKTSYFGQHGWDWTAPLVPFQTREEARARVREFEQETYYLGSGEVGRPELCVVKVRNASREAQERADADVDVWGSRV